MIEDGERHASWIELFFDLVFVAAVAALATQLHDDHSAAGLAVFAGLFVPVWWGWMGYTWYATGFASDDAVFRLGLLSGMLAIGALSAGVAGAAGGDSTTFVIAYACLFYVLAALYGRTWLATEAARPLAARLAIGNALGATLWLASLGLDESVRPIVWSVAMLLQITTFAFAPWSRSSDPFDPVHVAERYGLFTIVVLGESIVVTVAGLEIGSSVPAALVAVLGFVVAAAIWWLYFGIFRSMPVDRGFGGRFVWAQGHLLVFAGIAAAAVGVEFAIEAAAAGESLELADRLPLGAGLGAYLAALAAIRGANHRADWVAAMRLAVGATILALAIMGLGLDPLSFVALIAALVVAEAAIELSRAPPRGAPAPTAGSA